MSFVPSKTKKDALGRLGAALGYDFPLYVGSSVPKELFTAATHRAGVSDDGQMPDRAERVVEKAGLVWDSKCDSRDTPSGGGATVTLVGLNRLLEAIQLLTGSAVPQPEVDEPFGLQYRARTSEITADPMELTLDWDKLDQATQAHQDLEKALAQYVSTLGVSPRSPKPSEPAFDVAWQFNGTTVVVEVKSANESNRRQQMRLGIGQVLEYQGILRDNAPGDDYRAVLLLSIAPDGIDYLLSAESGVLVIGPGQFNELMLENLLPLA